MTDFQRISGDESGSPSTGEELVNAFNSNFESILARINSGEIKNLLPKYVDPNTLVETGIYIYNWEYGTTISFVCKDNFVIFQYDISLSGFKNRLSQDNGITWIKGGYCDFGVGSKMNIDENKTILGLNSFSFSGPSVSVGNDIQNNGLIYNSFSKRIGNSIAHTLEVEWQDCTGTISIQNIPFSPPFRLFGEYKGSDSVCNFGFIDIYMITDTSKQVIVNPLSSPIGDVSFSSGTLTIGMSAPYSDGKLFIEKII